MIFRADLPEESCLWSMMPPVQKGLVTPDGMMRRMRFQPPVWIFFSPEVLEGAPHEAAWENAPSMKSPQAKFQFLVSPETMYFVP